MLPGSSAMAFPLDVSNLPRSRDERRMGSSLIGNASSAGFRIVRCRPGDMEALAGDAGLCIPKLKLVLKLGAPGIEFALLICGAAKL